MGVDVADNFRPLYVLIAGKQPVIAELKAQLAQCAELILATDEDREGEAISWHLTEVLKPKVPVKRAVFHEITREAVCYAFENWRAVDMRLVEAQETRRVLDRLAGYTMSPLLWKKIARGLSAGRVQSVAMSVIVRRELERLRFVKAAFCGCSVRFGEGEEELRASLSMVDGRRLVRGGDFDGETGLVKEEVRERDLWMFDREEMERFCKRLRLEEAVVSSVEKRRTSRNSPAPFITSTLQQECGNRFGMGVGKTMRIAQKLYENGYITYMRTDNPTLSEQAVKTCRGVVKDLFGSGYVREKDDMRKVNKPKAAQAAHEAIRPAGNTFIRPEKLVDLEPEEVSVYSLIFKRTLASQMTSAKLDQTTIKIHVPLETGGLGELAEFKATGSVVVNPGFLQVYLAGDLDQDSRSYLPPVNEQQVLPGYDISILDHETKPPVRYNDASLVKELEELGVGRPSTYAAIIEKLITRGYIFRGQMLPEHKGVPPRALVPSLVAFVVDNLLSTHFPSFVDAEFTAGMEQALDEIAAGSEQRTQYLTTYYLGRDGLAESVQRTEDEIQPATYRQVLLPNMPGEMLGSMPTKNTVAQNTSPVKSSRTAAKQGVKSRSVYKNDRSTYDEGPDGGIDWSTTKVLISSYGPYIEQDGEVIASLPRTTLADDLSANRLGDVLQIAKDPELGTDPATGKPVLLKTSRYGPYVQLGRDEDAPEGTKPKRCGLFPGMDVGSLTVEVASKLLSLPRLLGTHPKSGQEIRAAMGPYGPYIVHNGTYVSLKKEVHDVLEISLDEALELVDTTEARKEVRRLKQEQGMGEKEKAKKLSTKMTPQQKAKRTSRSRGKNAAAKL